MEYLAPIILAAAIVLFLFRKRLGHVRQQAEAPPRETDARADEQARERRSVDVYTYSDRLSDAYQATAHPEDLFEIDSDFEEAVGLLCQPDFTVNVVSNYATGDNAIISCLAIEALRRRGDGDEAHAAILGCVGTIAPWPQYFGLKYLADRTPPDRPIIGLVLAQTTEYMDYRLSQSFLTEFIEHRVRAGEAPTFENVSVELDANALKSLRRFLENTDPGIGKLLLESFDHWRSVHVDQGFLRTAGRLWDEKDAKAAESVVEHALLLNAVDALEKALVADRPQSSLLVGEPGVGKTAILMKLASRLYDRGWIVFIAGHTDLIAGQVYVGQFEERLKAIVDQLRGDRQIVWFIPSFHTMAFAGRHRYSPTGALDVILPHVKQGDLRIVGETTPMALERLLQQQPQVSTALSALRVKPLTSQDTVNLANQWLRRVAPTQNPQLVDQAWELAQQYLGDRAAPGNLLGLLQATLHRLQAGTDSAQPILEFDDVVVTLAGQSGLPHAILDYRQTVDLDGLEAFLSQRVIGQEEAVHCLVERVAMMKAGVTDPTRPLGVFLFAGPTGTGKTEIAKSLAEWLFGDASRMLRLDMSELQTPQSLARLWGQAEDNQAESLADRIRQQPFSVVLLDEFEKAHPNVWDSFLQVFDDARITDYRGQTAEFRHAIIILTSNLGAKIPSGISMGFGARSQEFDAEEVKRAVDKAFRPEFINRLDRVIIFKPLSRDLMREILQKELVDAFQRRGLRNRAWAVEWDETAIEFLLEKGFTLDLGARPLKRAIEQYLLSPLAMTIVRHQVPEGDQFLFVSRKADRLDVTFVDPDAPSVDADEVPAAPEPASASSPADLTPQSILVQPRGTVEELAALRRHFEKLTAEVDGESWQARKDAAFAEMEDPAFWSSNGRFATLGLAEYLDRISAGARRAGSLLRRLEGRPGGRRSKVPPHMMGVLAQNLHLLQTACADVAEERPREAYLMIEVGPDGTQDWHHSLAFAGQLVAMYEGWARIRRMRLTELESLEGGTKRAFRKVYAVAGFGAYSLLAPEHGLHILELPDDRPRKFERVIVHVRVAPQADGPQPANPKALLRHVRQVLAEDDDADLTVVRRYREDPSPLVRDAVRGWRSGRLDLVLAGNFDAM